MSTVHHVTFIRYVAIYRLPPSHQLRGGTVPPAMDVGKRSTTERGLGTRASLEIRQRPQ
jgi:hypothetical protein